MQNSDKIVPFTNSFEASKIIDSHLEEYFNQEDMTGGKKEQLDNASFSGVDVDLSSLHQYLEMVGRNKVDNQKFHSGLVNFDKMKEYVKLKGMSLQIASSRALMSRVSKIPPKRISSGSQTDPTEEQEEIVKLQELVDDIQKLLEKRNTEIGHLKLQCEGLVKERESLKNQIFKLEVMVEQRDGYIKSYEETLSSKRALIKSLDDV